MFRLSSVHCALLLACNAGNGGNGGGGAGDAFSQDYIQGLSPVDLVSMGPDEVRELANMGSAPNLFMLAYLPAMVSDFDENCPVESETATSTIITGGCTDESGNAWVGRMEITPSTLTYEGFGWEEQLECDPSLTVSMIYDGTLRMSGVSSMNFTIDVVITGDVVDEHACTVRRETGLGIDYGGTMVDTVTPDDDGSIWNGQGWVGTPMSRLQAHTEDEVLHNDICGTEAASGTTTFTSGSDEIVITYDGETDCSPESTVQWSRNGTHQGELTGVACSAVRGADLGGLGVLVALLGLVRRRRA